MQVNIALFATTEASVEHAPTADSPSRRPNERRDATPHHRKSRPKMMTDCLQSWRLRTDQPDVPPSRKRDFK